jgi:chorismate mutase/prephenate dehydratase
MANLDELRRRIDELDEQIVTLLNARAAAVVEIGRLKRATGAGVFAPDREREVLDRVAALSSGPLSKQALLAIYKELMSASFALQRAPRVGCLGPAGSFSHEAALGKFGSSVEIEQRVDIRGVFEDVANGRLDYGVVPVENTLGGAVLDTLDSFAAYDVRICSEMTRAIRHNLLANCPQDAIEIVYSRPEAFAQCQRWLSETGLSRRISPAASTSRAAELASEQNNAAAIGSALAGKLYGLKIVAANIQDSPNNATRFLIIGGQTPRPTGTDRTSLLFVTAHQAGALVNVLLVFQKAGINMTMITSRPHPADAMQYYFFTDIDGHADDPPIHAALDQARAHCALLRVLGSYPKSTQLMTE